MIKSSPLRYLIPNTFTALSMALGVISAYLSTRGQFELAAWMITWGVLLDKLDGTTARLFNASSEFGVQFDSFADFIIFGLAPASLYFHWLGGVESAWLSVLAPVTCLYVVVTAIRLAFFNVSELPGGDRYFYGVPTTLTGATLSTLYLTVAVWSPELKEVGSLDESAQLSLIGLLILFAVLMVSRLILPKLKPRKSKLVNIFQFTNVGIAYVIAPCKLWPDYLFVLCVTYIMIGLISGLMHGIEEEAIDPSHA